MVVTAHDGGWEVAADLLAAGVQVAAVADERPGAEPPGAAEVAASGAEVLTGYTIGAARGRKRVRAAVLVPVSGSGFEAPGALRSRRRQHRAAALGGARLDGRSRQPLRRGARRDAGGGPAGGGVPGGAGRRPARPVEAEEEHGRRSGADAAAHALGAETPEAIAAHALGADTATAGNAPGDHPQPVAAAHAQGAGTAEAGQSPEAGAARPLAADPAEARALGADPAEAEAAPPGETPSRSSALVSAPACGGGKRFVCLCEDVTDADVDTSLAEGYDHLELLKRYTTIGMGPCQGRMCNLHGIRLCAAGTGRSVQETGRTTARPPVTPLSLGTLAGQKMEPVQVSAMHDWHLARGARMMTAGTWLRPERYGDPVEEVAAVRNSVGLIDVSPLGKLRLTGPGVPDLLEPALREHLARPAAGGCATA